MISSEDPRPEEAPGPSAVDHDDRAGPADDDTIRALVIRLSRDHSSGGKVIERAAILASGGDLEAVMSWITDHAGQAETTASAKSARGLHAARPSHANPPRRYVLPAGALD